MEHFSFHYNESSRNLWKLLQVIAKFHCKSDSRYSFCFQKYKSDNLRKGRIERRQLRLFHRTAWLNESYAWILDSSGKTICSLRDGGKSLLSVFNKRRCSKDKRRAGAEIHFFLVECFLEMMLKQAYFHFFCGEYYFIYWKHIHIVDCDADKIYIYKTNMV